MRKLLLYANKSSFLNLLTILDLIKIIFKREESYTNLPLTRMSWNSPLYSNKVILHEKTRGTYRHSLPYPVSTFSYTSRTPVIAVVTESRLNRGISESEFFTISFKSMHFTDTLSLKRA